MLDLIYNVISEIKRISIEVVIPAFYIMCSVMNIILKELINLNIMTFIGLLVNRNNMI